MLRGIQRLHYESTTKQHTRTHSLTHTLTHTHKSRCGPQQKCHLIICEKMRPAAATDQTAPYCAPYRCSTCCVCVMCVVCVWHFTPASVESRWQRVAAKKTLPFCPPAMDQASEVRKGARARDEEIARVRECVIMRWQS